MQPSKEREAGETRDTGDGDPLDDLDDLLDDDLAGGDGGADVGTDATSGDAAGPAATSRPPAGSDRTSGRVGVDGRWFSLKGFAVALLAVVVGTVLAGLVPLVGGTVGGVAGVLLGTFLVGLVFASSNYVETGLAGALAGAGTAVSSVFGVGFLPIGIDYLGRWGLPLLAVGAGVGLLCGLVGHYFGRDLRAGITGELPE